MAIDTPSDVVAEMREDYEIIEDLRGGTKRMREKSTEYLPMNPGEERVDYDYRLVTSTLYNVLERTLRVLSAKPFSSPPTLEGFESQDLKSWVDNINLEGQRLDMFAKEVFTHALAAGVSYIFVDNPVVSEGTTLADVRNNGIRPYLLSVPMSNVLGWKSQKENGTEKLVEVRFLLDSDVPDPDDEYAVSTVEDVMLLRRGTGFCTWERYRKNEENGLWEVVEEGLLTVKEIPFIPVYTKRKVFMVGVPPLRDLADLNVKHWQSSSDQDYILHYARVPILYAAGWADDKDVVIGGGRMVKNTSPTASIQFVEHSGAAITAGKEALSDLEDQMAAIGAELLLKKESGDVTATEAALDSAAGMCDLAEMTVSLDDAFNLAFEYMGEYAGTTPGTVSFFKDFAVSALGISDMSVLLSMQGTGIVSKRVVFEEAQRRKLLSDVYVFDEVKSEADEELQGMADMFGNPNATAGEGDA